MEQTAGRGAEDKRNDMSDADPGLHLKYLSNDVILIVQVYVDDIRIAAQSKTEIA